MSELHYQRDSKKAVYVSNEMFRALWLISQSETRSWKDPNTRPPNITTPDEVADKILRETIKAKYPQLFEFQKEQEKAEKTLIESLRTNKTLIETLRINESNQRTV